MFKIVGTTIHLTRGDVAALNIKAKQDDELYYIFKPDDVVRFKIIKKNDCNTIYLKKEVVVTEETENVVIFLTREDTKLEGIINKPSSYWYEVELNPDTYPQTIIGYDNVTGAKILTLYPEGGNE